MHLSRCQNKWTTEICIRMKQTLNLSARFFTLLLKNVKKREEMKCVQSMLEINDGKIKVSTYTYSKLTNQSLSQIQYFRFFLFFFWEFGKWTFFVLSKFVSHCFFWVTQNSDLNGYTIFVFMFCVFLVIHLAHRICTTHSFTPFASLRTTKLWWSK